MKEEREIFAGDGLEGSSLAIRFMVASGEGGIEVAMMWIQIDGTATSCARSRFALCIEPFPTLSSMTSRVSP